MSTNTQHQISENGSITYRGYDFGDQKEIHRVEVDLQSSTSRARIFNIALKLSTLDWTDVTLDIIEEIADVRLNELATGTNYAVRYTYSQYKKEKSDRHATTFQKTCTVERAIELALENAKRCTRNDVKIVSVETREEYIAREEKEKAERDAKKSD